MRIYKSVRLAGVTSIWANELIQAKQKELDIEIRNGLIEQSETYLLKKFPSLNGVSRNIVFKVSFSSIVEMCYRLTENYDTSDWEELAQQMEKDKTVSSEASNTPKLYLEDSIWRGIEDYQRKLMGEENKRILRLSYIIKLILYAGWRAYQSDEKI
ncbi:hypothetical protein KQI19_05505 [Enterococcus gallinarum]|uniref:hypothetical protein n=1 Tax=Enterococcus TaxID=1350 RepID=UPI0001B6B184|nr:MULTISPECIES: hypothetical protein [Enterococcus]EEV33023.1 predicted protein [Enterococcus gallinarum EG2]MBU5357602.1 hypothetical protein [Enterococcus gallinarum]MDV7688189.1 hypothetical protein [Enterococcus casseliflavus]